MWTLFVAIAALALGAPFMAVVLLVLGVRFVRRHVLGKGDKDDGRQPSLNSGRPTVSLPASVHKGCPRDEGISLRGMERRLETARRQSIEAMDRRLSSQVARSRVAPPLDEAYVQIKSEIASIYAFCERNDLAGTLRKARQSASAQDIYLEAYERDLAKVRAAIGKTEECLTAYERTVATLEVSSVEADISSDFDASIEMLRDLRKELPLYSLEDRV